MDEQRNKGGFRSAAQRKLDALNAARGKWQQRTTEEDDDGAQQDEAEKRQKLLHAASSASAAAASSVARAASSGTGVVDVSHDGDDGPVVVSDASAAEEAMLAAMFPARFGKAEKKGPDLDKLNAARVRKDRDADAQGPVVKIEGAPERAPQPQSQRPAPRTVAPAAPPSLLGGSYDSSDDDDDGEGEKKGASSAAASSAALAPAAAAAAAVSTDDEESDDDDTYVDASGRRLPALMRQVPLSHEAELRTNGHTKTVSALAVDKAGGRVLSGSYDYQAKLWDFGGMNETLAAFRTFEPVEGHPLRALNYSPQGDMFLAVTHSAQAKLYTRDAGEVATFARGDMYILDQKLTKGHSTPLTSGWIHPRDKGCVVTSAIDGTVRLWDCNRPDNNISVVKPRGVSRGTAISATGISKDGKMIAAAATDGSLHILKCSKAFHYADSLVLPSAHVKGTETSALLFASDNVTLFSRGGDHDHTLKSWDVRALRQPLAVLADLENAYPETDIALSPDEKVLVTGTSGRDKSAGAAGGEVDSGHAVFIDRAGLKPLQRVSMGCRSVVRSVWHAGINQLLFGCSDGVVRLLYSPSLSNKGVLQCIGRRARAKNPLDFAQDHVGAIITPHALPGQRGDEASANRKRKREKEAAALAPEAPVTGRYGVGGRAGGSSSMAAFHLSKVVSMRADPREKDPREALLAMDALAKADPVFFGKAYAATQPTPILAKVSEEERAVKMTEEEVALHNRREGAKEGQGRSA